MKKEAFFALLKEKLNVIEESELQDILDEYEQHISMKMIDENVSEEEAIEGFGDIDELTAEILQAYHVRVQDNRKKKQEILEKRKKLFSDAKKQVSHIFEKKEKESAKEGTEEVKRKSTVSFGEKWSKFCRKLKNGIGTFCVGCCKVVAFCIKWLWQLFCLFLLLLAGCGSCFLLFLFGTSLVLLLQNYPMWGILIVCMGMTFSFLAVTTALVRYMKGEKKSSWAWLKKGTPAMVLSMVFFGGALLSGIGTGIGFLEFSKFTYGGEISLQKEGELRTGQAIVEVPLEGVKTIDVQNIQGENQNLVKEFTWDDSIPMGQICYEIQSTSEGMAFRADFTSHVETEPQYITESTADLAETPNPERNLDVYFYSYERSGLRTFLLLKDVFLADLKNRELHDYKTELNIKSARILVNPAMKDLVRLY